MKIYGLQKMTLLDYPGHVACTIFLNGCDFACPYCHNAELARGTAPAVMEEEELLTFLKKREGLLDGVAITGGEPCLHSALPALAEKIHGLGFLVKLDTNGAHPDMLRRLCEGGLVDYVAMDIKNSPEKYALTAGLESFDLAPVRESIRFLMKGKTDYEFRTTIVRQLHTDEDVRKMAEMIAGARRYFLQSFTDRDSVPFAGLLPHTPEKMETMAQIARCYVADTQVRGTQT